MNDIICYCGSGKLFKECCRPYITGIKKAPAPVALMRSRYSAYATHNADYLWATTYPEQRKYHSKTAILQWAESNQWLKLEILNFTETVVEFKAYYLDEMLKAQIHHEKSRFIKENNIWYYVDGEY